MPGLVRIVATGTVAILYWLMHHRPQMQLVMTGITKGCHILNRLKLMPVWLFCLVTEATITRGNRTVDILIFAHIRVTFRSHTALLLLQRKTLGNRQIRHHDR